jgi:nucleotide-binding universal stress UspA family protein
LRIEIEIVILRAFILFIPAQKARAMFKPADVSIKKILVPIDGSDASSKAANYAIHIAKLENAELIVINIKEDVRQGGAIGLQAKYGNVDLVQAFKKSMTESARQWINPVEEAAKRNGIRIKSEILDQERTSKSGAIIKYAEKNNIDIIIIGAKGMSKFERLLIGSITNSVVTHSTCPVLVVR